VEPAQGDGVQVEIGLEVRLDEPPGVAVQVEDEGDAASQREHEPAHASWPCPGRAEGCEGRHGFRVTHAGTPDETVMRAQTRAAATRLLTRARNLPSGS